MTQPKQPLVIEAGRHYVTRSGLRSRVYAVDSGGGFPIHGAVCSPSRWALEKWTDSGRTYIDEEHPNDLIAPWIDRPTVNWSDMPAWAKWAAMDKSGEWSFYEEHPNIFSDVWSAASDRYAATAIPPDYAPKWTGDWRESLVARPEVEGGK